MHPDIDETVLYGHPTDWGRATDPATAFDELVWDHPARCNNCFETVRQRVDLDALGIEPNQGNTISANAWTGTETNAAAGGARGETAVATQHVGMTTVRAPADDAIVGSAPRVVGTEAATESWYRPLHRQATYCGRCGAEHGRADDDPLSLPEAVDRAGTLSDVLASHYVTHDRDALYRFVRRAKRIPKYEAFDTEIFRYGVKAAVRIGGEQ